MPTRQLVRAYVDETGDRGVSATASPYFAFAALLIADEQEGQMRAAMSQLRRDLKVPPGKALHWKDHVKVHPRRQYVASTLAQLPNVKIVYVVVEKAAIPAHAGMRRDQVLFYNFAAGITLERLLLAAKNWEGGSRDLVVKFGHVRGFDHRTTCDYFKIKPQNNPGYIPWGLLRGQPTFEDQAKWDGLQAADQYAGMLSAAVRPDRYGGYEATHLLAIRHQLRRDWRGASRNYGFKILGNEATFTSLPWWPPQGL
ncbi:DUF3800 domain-containing protein [Streptomyces sp. WAC01280]|uniref:DUF3800 domain-containing protein n=1 Tax=Streptomyces sp. WAC01280 TaxID=2487424 RepID=UPI000F76D1ED|nr:DUF3800 domain-containing protein [Streptomyces sp. WAC01280]RSS53244.1 DUF3800 domain-containing protein [Streptomyces sp. WAC01280]